jgi:hypothetical protein
MALIYRIAFQVAQYGPRIKSLDSVEALLSSIYVYENGEIDYGEVEVVDPESGMTPQKVQAYVRQLLGKELYYRLISPASRDQWTKTKEDLSLR